MGTRAERTRVAMAGPRLAECGTKGQAVRPPADPAAPHSRTDKPRGPDSRVAENGAGRAAGSTLRPHIRAQINRTNGGERSRPRNPGLKLGEIKPQTSD